MAVNSASALVHIGFPKCASSFLQLDVFPRIAGLHIEKPWSNLAFDRFVLTDPFDFDPVRVAGEFGAADGLVPVITNENLVGGPGARTGTWLATTADRIHETFPEAKILLVVREQRSMVLSLYRQLVKRGEHTALREAIQPTGAPGYHPRLRLERLRYHLAVQAYLDRFGADRVLVIPFELLRNDAQGFVDAVASFATGAEPGTLRGPFEKVNEGYRGFTLETRRTLNRVAAENYTGPGGPPLSFRAANKFSLAMHMAVPDSMHRRTETIHRETVAEVVGDMFVESNRLLGQQTGLDLAGLGYMV
jgi:hypothetical protein